MSAKKSDDQLKRELGMLGGAWAFVEETRKPAIEAMRQDAWDRIEYVRSLSATSCTCPEGETGRDGEPVVHTHGDLEDRIATEESNFMEVHRSWGLLDDHVKDLEKQAKPLKAQAVKRGMPLG